MIPAIFFKIINIISYELLLSSLQSTMVTGLAVLLSTSMISWDILRKKYFCYLIPTSYPLRLIHYFLAYCFKIVVFLNKMWKYSHQSVIYNCKVLANLFKELLCDLPPYQSSKKITWKKVFAAATFEGLWVVSFQTE